MRCAPPVVVGDRVIAQHPFRHGNDAPLVPKDSVGDVVAIHPSTNDYVVNFGKEFGISIALYERDDVQPLEGVRSSKNAAAADQEEDGTYNGGPVLDKGMRVEVTEKCGKEPKMKVGSLGTIIKVDAQNDFYVSFDDVSETGGKKNTQWVYYQRRQIRGSLPKPGEYVKVVCDTSDDGVGVGEIGVVKDISHQGAQEAKEAGEVGSTAKCLFSEAPPVDIPSSSLVSVLRPLKNGDVVVTRQSFNYDKAAAPVPVGTLGSVVSETSSSGYAKVVFPTLAEDPVRFVRWTYMDVRHLTEEELASGMGEAHFERASSSEQQDIAKALKGIAISESDWAKVHEREKEDTVSHRILFCIAAGEGGIGHGDLVVFTHPKTSDQYTCVVIDLNVEDKTYDLQVLVNGKETDVILPNIKKKGVKRLAAGIGQKSKGDDIDLRGPWSGDVSLLLQSLGDDFGFSISKRSGSAGERDEFLVTLHDYFEECQWSYDYYWVYYSGHGSSNGGNWCLPDSTKVGFSDVRGVWNASSASKRGARLVIVSDSCYAGKWCDALRESGDKNIAVQSASVAESTSADMGWNGGRFTSEWTRVAKKVANAKKNGGGFKVGDEFELSRDFKTTKYNLKTGLKGVITKIDSDGDYYSKMASKIRDKYPGNDKRNNNLWILNKWNIMSATDGEDQQKIHDGIVKQLEKAGDELKKQGSDCVCGWLDHVEGEDGTKYVQIKSAPLFFAVPETDKS